MCMWCSREYLPNIWAQLEMQFESFRHALPVTMLLQHQEQDKHLEAKKQKTPSVKNYSRLEDRNLIDACN